MNEIHRIGIVGAGQMGVGIAQVAAQAGLGVALHDANPLLLDRAEAQLTRAFARLEQRGKLSSAARADAEQRIALLYDLGDLAHAEFVIEAVTECEKTKVELFAALDRVCPPETVLATNTSSISITRLGRASGRPSKVIGMHFMNPPAVMPLVEIVLGLVTDPETHQVTERLARRLGKTTMVSGDSPGFIVNRILLPMINEAIYVAFEGVARPEDVDAAMKLGSNQPMGPFELADLIGLDTCLAIMEVMHRVLGDDKYRPCPLLKRYVDAGYLGRKAGRGFYDYSGDGAAAPAGP